MSPLLAQGGIQPTERGLKQGDSHQKRCVLFTPDSPTSELLLKPDAVFASGGETKRQNMAKGRESFFPPPSSSLWFPCEGGDILRLVSLSPTGFWPPAAAWRLFKNTKVSPLPG